MIAGALRGVSLADMLPASKQRKARTIPLVLAQEA